MSPVGEGTLPNGNSSFMCAAQCGVESIPTPPELLMFDVGFSRATSASSDHVTLDHPPEESLVVVRRRKAGLVSTFWNTLKLSVGIGMLTFPYSFAQAGIVPSVVTLALMGVLTIVAVRGLVGAMRCAKEHTQQEVVSYMDTVQVFLGRRWTAATALCLCLGQAGVSIGYEIFICNTFVQYFGFFSYTGWLMVLQVPLLALCAVRSMRLLGLASFAGMVCLWCGFGAALFLMEREGTHHGWARMDAVTDLRGYLLLFGVVSLAFEGLAATAVTIEQSMARPEMFTQVLCAAVALVAATECAFGLFGYAAFGRSAAQVITLSFPKDSGLSTAVSVCFSLELLFTFPGNMYPIWKFMEEFVCPCPFPGQLSDPLMVDQPGPTSAAVPAPSRRLVRVLRSTSLRSVTVLAMASVAWRFRYTFAEFISLVGSLICASILFLIPARIQFSLVQPYSFAWLTAMLLFAFGVSALVVGTAIAVGV